VIDIGGTNVKGLPPVRRTPQISVRSLDDASAKVAGVKKLIVDWKYDLTNHRLMWLLTGQGLTS